MGKWGKNAGYIFKVRLDKEWACQCLNPSDKKGEKDEGLLYKSKGNTRGVWLAYENKHKLILDYNNTTHEEWKREDIYDFIPDEWLFSSDIIHLTHQKHFSFGRIMMERNKLRKLKILHVYKCDFAIIWELLWLLKVLFSFFYSFLHSVSDEIF